MILEQLTLRRLLPLPRASKPSSSPRRRGAQAPAHRPVRRHQRRRQDHAARRDPARPLRRRGPAARSGRTCRTTTSCASPSTTAINAGGERGGVAVVPLRRRRRRSTCTTCAGRGSWPRAGCARNCACSRTASPSRGCRTTGRSWSKTSSRWTSRSCSSSTRRRSARSRRTRAAARPSARPIKSLLGLDIVERLIADSTVLQTRLAKKGGSPEHQAAGGGHSSSLLRERQTSLDGLNAERAALENNGCAPRPRCSRPKRRSPAVGPHWDARAGAQPAPGRSDAVRRATSRRSSLDARRGRAAAGPGWRPAGDGRRSRTAGAVRRGR